MASGSWHYQEAERLAALAVEAARENVHSASAVAAVAQVHATLAQTVATLSAGSPLPQEVADTWGKVTK